MNRVSGALVAVAAGFFAFSAEAAQVSLTDISGVWSAATLNNGGAPSGLGTSAISWGVPDTPKGQSGYTFDAAAPASDLVADTPFAFGQFTHSNFPIYDPSLVSAQLSLSFDLVVDGVAQTLNATYTFNHTETPNDGGGNNCCNDLVEFLTSAVSFDSVTIGGVEYTFKLDGFVTDAGKPVSFFSTEEGKRNTATLVGRFTTVEPVDPGPSPVPLPLPVAMLGFGVTGLGVLGKLRRKA